MVDNPISLRGVFTPIVTSFDQGGDVAHDKMALNLEKWNQTGLSGYVVLGSNGEWVYLDEEERRAVLENTRQAIPPDKLMIAGTAAESTRHTIRLTEEAAKIGADVAIIVNPNYYKSQMTVPVLTGYYEAVADASPIPIMIYNLPPATGMDLPADLLVALSQHPNIVAVKDTGGNIAKMGETIRRADWLSGSVRLGQLFLPIDGHGRDRAAFWPWPTWRRTSRWPSMTCSRPERLTRDGSCTCGCCPSIWPSPAASASPASRRRWTWRAFMAGRRACRCAPWMMSGARN